MKTALIRILTIATLATSISAFAATDESKHNDAATTSASAKQEGCGDRADAGKKEQTARSQRQLDGQRSQNEKDFERVLMSIYG